MNFFSQITNIFKRQYDNVVRSLSKYAKLLNKPAVALNAYVKNFFNTMMKAPSSKEDYIHVSDRYYAKKVVFYLIIALVIIFYLLFQYVFPWAEGKLYLPTIEINSEKYLGYNGKAKITDHAGNLIYEGDLAEGEVTGTGVQYDRQGNVIYKGNFVGSEYSGVGALYQNGILCYKGEFSKNQYNGKGTLYDDSGKTTYVGEFENGVPNGVGTFYEPETGKAMYSGGVADGQMSGEGKLYDKEGKEIVYAGGFALGKFSGKGKQYDEKTGNLLYEGEFSEGEFQGVGTSYFPDSGKIKYSGEFAGGEIAGKGILYDETMNRPVYEGSFLNGEKSGEGILYDTQKGGVLVKGNFYNGKIDWPSYLGKNEDEIFAAFAKESSQVVGDEGIAKFYTKLHVAVLFDFVQDDKPICSKIIVDPQGEIAAEEILNQYGVSFNYGRFALNSLQKQAITGLGLYLPDELHMTKYVLDNYYIRYYAKSKDTQNICYEYGTVDPFTTTE